MAHRLCGDEGPSLGTLSDRVDAIGETVEEHDETIDALQSQVARLDAVVRILTEALVRDTGATVVGGKIAWRQPIEDWTNEDDRAHEAKCRADIAALLEEP